MGSDITTPLQDSLSRKDHKLVADYIERIAGIQLPESKMSLIEGRLRKRQRKTGYKSLHEYINVSAHHCSNRLPLLIIQTRASSLAA